jgi:hypothetical protein
LWLCTGRDVSVDAIHTLVAVVLQVVLLKLGSVGNHERPEWCYAYVTNMLQVYYKRVTNMLKSVAGIMHVPVGEEGVVDVLLGLLEEEVVRPNISIHVSRCIRRCGVKPTG